MRLALAVVERLLEHPTQQLIGRNGPRMTKRGPGIGHEIVEPQRSAHGVRRRSGAWLTAAAKRLGASAVSAPT